MRVAVLIAIASLLPSLAYAAPTVSGVSGTLTHGQSVTITGSGFGTKSTAAPVVWDDCESGTISSKWDSLYPYAADDSTFNMQYRTTYRDVAQAHSVSTKYAVGGHAASGYSTWRNNAGPNVLLAKHLTSGQRDAEYFYASYYYRSDPSWPSTNHNYKVFRVSDGTELDCDGGGYYLEYNPVTITSPGYHTIYTSPGYYGSDDGMRGADPRSAWIKIEIVTHIVDGSTGYIRVYENGALKYDLSGESSLDFSNGVTYDIVVFGEYWRKSDSPETGDDNAFRYFDDLYFDTTLSRVIVGNASTFTACTVREIQPATAWSSSSITVTLNRGSFGASSTAYVYVVDSTGAVNSSGYSVTFGSGGDSVPGFVGVGLSGVGVN